MDSTPPATTTSMRSTITCLAAVAMVIMPDAHWRSIDIPATVTGSPARSAAVRPMVVCTPCCRAAPMITSSISAGSSFARSIAARIGCAARVGEGVALNAPRYALPMPVRAVETITASRAILLSSNDHQAEPDGGQRGRVPALDLDRHGVTQQQLPRRFLLDRVKREAAAHPASGP